MDELLSCPFCGGKPVPTMHLSYNWFAPVCASCNARGPSIKILPGSSKQEISRLLRLANDSWNRRVLHDE